jgi:hypothetical protein
VDRQAVNDDARAAWIFAALIVTVLAILGVVIQSFSLHSALARGKVHAPELAGIRLLALWLPTTFVWLAAGIGMGVFDPSDHCAPGDWAMLWLALLYPLTLWPALFLARRAGVRLGLGYFFAQSLAPLTLFFMGGLPCVI